MCIYSSFATFLHLYVLSSSRKDDRIAAHSFWIISRSSAWVLAVRMVRISSRSLMGAGILWEKREIHKPSTVPENFINFLSLAYSFFPYNYINGRMKKKANSFTSMVKSKPKDHRILLYLPGTEVLTIAFLDAETAMLWTSCQVNITWFPSEIDKNSTQQDMFMLIFSASHQRGLILKSWQCGTQTILYKKQCC